MDAMVGRPRAEPSERRAAFLAAALLAFSALAGAAPEPLSPSESLAAWRVPEGVRVELVAAEPDVVDPVAMAFAEDGDLFVVENRGYPGPLSPKDLASAPRLGRVALLRDPDGDGVYARASDFASDLAFPNGVMPWRGGILVTDAPDLLFLKDADGDGRADERRVVLTGFSLGGSTQLRASHPTLGPDGWIHLTNGLSGGKLRSPDAPEDAALDIGGLDARWNPFTGAVEPFAGRAQFGLAFDDAGGKFFCDNRKHLQFVVLRPTDLARNPHLARTETVADPTGFGGGAPVFPVGPARTTALAHAGTFTAACGLALYRGSSLPEEYRGDAFVCDPTGALVHCDDLAPDGASWRATPAFDGREFLASSDPWCRPVFLCNGPAGALYLCDMARGTIEHPTYLAPQVREATDFDAGKDRGRLWRIVGASEKRGVPPDALLPSPSDAEAIAALGDPDGWRRDAAFRLLLERGEEADAEALRAALRHAPSPVARVGALRLLAARGPASSEALPIEDAVRATRDASPVLREAALSALRPRLANSPEALRAILAAASDDSPRVRFVVALALGDAPTAAPGVAEAAASILKRDLADPWTRAAVFSSIAGRVGAFARAFAAAPPDGAPEGLADAVEEIGRLLALGESRAATFDWLESATQAAVRARAERDADWPFLEALVGSADGVSRSTNFPGDAPPLWRLLDRARIDSRPDVAMPLGLFAAVALDLLDPESKASREASGAGLGDMPLLPRRLDDAYRLRAARLAGYAGFDRAGNALLGLLSPAASPELQVEAVRALARTGDDRIADPLLDRDRWRTLRAATRSLALDALLADADRTARLLDAVERGDVPPWSVDAAARARLARSPDPAIRDRAAKLLGTASRADREKVFEELKPILREPADAPNGREVFRRSCAQCHVFRGEGHSVGPDLSDVAAHPPESILMHVLMPNWLMVAGYENYVAETTDGETVSGLVASESPAAVTIRGPLGAETTIPRDRLRALYATSLSMMPEELERGMSRAELRDLVSFLSAP